MSILKSIRDRVFPRKPAQRGADEESYPVDPADCECPETQRTMEKTASGVRVVCGQCGREHSF